MLRTLPTALARHAMARPRAWGLAIAIATLGLGAGVPQLELRTDGDALRPDGDAIVEATRRDARIFREPRRALVLVESRDGGAAVASPEGFRFLVDLHRALRHSSAVQADRVQSLASLPELSRGGGGIAVGTYLDDVPDEGPAFRRLLERVRAVTPTEGLLLARDGRRAAIHLPLAHDVPPGEALPAVEALLAREADPAFALHLTGPVVAETRLGERVLRDLALFVPVMLAGIALLLRVALGDRAGVIVPLCEAGTVLVWTLGAMGWLGIPVTIATTVVPVVLLTMAITDEVHLLERLQALRGGGPLRDDVVRAVDEVGLPIVVTSLTTAAGFLSFLSSDIAPLRHFGLAIAFGILVAMALSFCGVPALLVTLPEGWLRARRHAGPSRWDAPARLAARHPGAALALVAVLLLLLAPGIARLRVQDSWLENFPDDDPLAVAARRLDASFWGAYRFDVVLEGRPGLFHAPEGMQLLAAVRELGASAPGVAGSLGPLDPLEAVARSLGHRGPLAALDPVALADVITVSEMSRGAVPLGEVLSDDGGSARTQLFVRDADYARADALMRHLEQRLPAVLAGRATWRATGDLPVALSVVHAVVEGQLRSIAWTLATVTAILALLFARGRALAVALAPVVGAVLAVLGGMGWTGLPLGIATSMFASLTVGVGVDFGIHTLHRHRRELAEGYTGADARLRTVDAAGRALRWNAGVLATGFALLLGSGLRPNHDLGLLLAAAIVACYLACMLATPRLLQWLAPGVALLVLGLAAPPATAASPCPVEPDAAATARMQAIETRLRGQPRLVRMAIETLYPDDHPQADYYREHPARKTLWGVFDGGRERTRMLYVFSGPGRLAGTSLLIDDVASGVEQDRMWLYLRSFGTFTELAEGARRVLVPGTVLTYEDARAFLPGDSYHFAVDPSVEKGGAAGKGEALEPEGAPDAPLTRILACPLDADVREDLGYDHVRIELDPGADLVRRVAYADLGGKPFKIWQLIEPVTVAGRPHAGRVEMTHLTEGRRTRVDHEHWALPRPPPEDVFSPDVADRSFLDRLHRTVTAAGLGERLDAELAAADAVVAAWEARQRARAADGSDPSEGESAP